jgi:hypothetical protein
MICVPLADELADDDALVRCVTGDPVGCKEMDDIEQIRPQIRAQLFQSGTGEQCPGVAVINVFADELLSFPGQSSHSGKHGRVAVFLCDAR